MRATRRITYSAALAAVAVLAACSSTSSSGSAAQNTSAPVAATANGSAQQITLHATDQLRFAPASIVVHPGTVQVKLIDDGSYPHNFSVPDLHVTSATVTGNPGQQSTTTTLTFAHPGTYEFVCTFHASAGMRGQVVVK